MNAKRLIREALRSGTIAGIAMIPAAAIFRARAFIPGDADR